VYSNFDKTELIMYHVLVFDWRRLYSLFVLFFLT